MAFTIITVTGTYRNVDLSPAQGTVSFRASDEMANGGNIQEPTVTVGILDVNGHMSVTLPAVDDAGTMPAGVTYEVFEAIHGAPERAWNFSLGHTINPYDISLAAPALSPTAAYNYALDVNLVHNAGNETIGGVKTFTSAPIVPSNSFPESAITNLTTDLAAKATDSLVIHFAGSESITGAKTFSTNPLFNDAAIPQVKIANLVSDLALKAVDSLVVHLAGTETVTGAKTFSGQVNVTGNNLRVGGTDRVATDGSLQNIKSLTFGGGGPYNIGAGAVSDIINLAFGNMRVVVGGVAGGSAPSLTAEQALLTVTPFTNEVVSTGFTTQRYTVFSAPSISVSNGQTLTNAATLAVAGAPSNSGAGTLTNPYAIWGQAGLSRLATLLVDNGLTITAGGVTLPAGSIADAALASTFVHLGGAVNESITGIKTFNSAPVVPSNSFPESAITNLTADLAAKATDSLVVHLAGTETITGLKTATVPFTAQAFSITGLTGAIQPTRLGGATVSGPPTTGTWQIGDQVPDQSGQYWFCNNFLYPATIMLHGANAFWMLNDAGATAIDQVAGLNGTLNGGITTGVAGPNSDGQTAMTFNGTTGYIDCGTAAPLYQIGEPFSLVVIAKQSASSGFRDLVSNAQIGSNLNFNYVMQFDGAGKMRCQFGNASAQYTGTVDDGLYHRWVGTYDGGGAGSTTATKLYKDGVLVATGSGPSANTLTSLSLAIGRGNATAGRYYNGTLAAIGIFKGICLSPFQIALDNLIGSASFPYSFVAGALTTALRPIFNVRDYGAKGDGRFVRDAAIISGAAIVTSTAANFTNADVANRREVCIAGAGTAGAGYRGMVLSVSGNTATLDTNAATTVTNAYATIGADDCAVLRRVEALAEVSGGTVYRPAQGGYYLLNSYFSGTGTGTHNIRVNASNVRWTSDGPAAALLQGPAGVNIAAQTTMISLGDPSFNGTMAAQPQYLYNAAKRADPSITTTTAADAGNFMVGDVFYIQSGLVHSSGYYSEINIVTSVNASTGVIGLQWPLGKDYPQDATIAPYFCTPATFDTLKNVTFENEYWYSIDRLTNGGGIIGLNYIRCHWEKDASALNQAGALGDAMGNGDIRQWRISNCEFTYDRAFTQFCNGMSDLLIADTWFTQRVAAAGEHNIEFSEHMDHARMSRCYIRFPGIPGSVTYKGSVNISAIWDLEIENCYIYMSDVAASPYGFAINDVGGHDVVIRGNHIWGGISSKSDGHIIDSNHIHQNTTAQAIYSDPAFGSGAAIIQNNRIYLTTAPSTGIYGEGTLRNWHCIGNKIFGDGTAGQRAIAIADNGAQTASTRFLDNYGTGCDIGLYVVNPANELLVTGNNDFSGCTTPYQTGGGELSVSGLRPPTLKILAGYALQRFTKFEIPTVTAASALTVSDAATVAIAGAPVAAGSAIITRPYAFWVQSGLTQFDGLLKATAALTISSGDLTMSTGNVVGLRDKGGEKFNVKAYGAVGNTKVVSDATTTAGSATVTCTTSAPFTSTAVDAGKTVWVEGAGLITGPNGIAWKTTILTVTDSTHAVMAATAPASYSNARMMFGATDLSALQTAQTAALKNGYLYWPDGGFLLDGTTALLLGQGERWRGTWNNDQGVTAATNAGTRLIQPSAFIGKFNSLNLTYTTQTLTDNDNPGWTTNQWVGYQVWAGDYWGVITSNTGNVLTLGAITCGKSDNTTYTQYWLPADPGVLSQPANTQNYRILKPVLELAVPSPNSFSYGLQLRNLWLDGGSFSLHAPNGLIQGRISEILFGPYLAGIHWQSSLQQLEGDHLNFTGGRYSFLHNAELGRNFGAVTDVFADKNHFYGVFCASQAGNAVLWKTRSSNNNTFLDLTTSGIGGSTCIFDGNITNLSFKGWNTEQNGNSEGINGANLAKAIAAWGNNAISQATLNVSNDTGNGYANGNVVTIQGGGSSGADIQLPIRSGGGTSAWTMGLADPTITPVITQVVGGGSLVADTYTLALTYLTAGGETLAGPSSTGVAINLNDQLQVALISAIPTGTTSVKFYLTRSANTTLAATKTPNNQGVIPAFNITTAGSVSSPPGGNTSGNLLTAVNALYQNTAGGGGVTYGANTVIDTGQTWTKAIVGMAIFAGTPGSGVKSGTILSTSGNTATLTGNWTGGTPAANSGYSIGGPDITCRSFSELLVQNLWGSPQSLSIYDAQIGLEGTAGAQRYGADFSKVSATVRMVNVGGSRPIYDPQYVANEDGGIARFRRPVLTSAYKVVHDTGQSATATVPNQPGHRTIVSPSGGSLRFILRDSFDSLLGGFGFFEVTQNDTNSTLLMRLQSTQSAAPGLGLRNGLSVGSTGPPATTLLSVQSTDAFALAVGPNGNTGNPSLVVDASTASVVTGLKIKGAASGAGLALSVISSATNEALALDAKGSGAVTIGGVSTGLITLARDFAASKAFRRSTQTPTETVLVSGVDATTGEEIEVTLSAARVVGAPLNPALGQELTFTLIQNGTGGWAVTWNAAFKVSWSDTGNTLNKRSSIVFWYDGTNWNQKGAQTPYV